MYTLVVDDIEIPLNTAEDFLEACALISNSSGNFKIITSLRASGRTSRMLEEARRTKDSLVVVSPEHIRRMKGEGVRVTSSENVNFDTMRAFGIHHTALFVDHSVIERRFHKLLAELHRYD